jgi:hypothetical protein
MSSDINLPEVGDNGNLDGICEVLSSTDQYLDSYSMNNNSSRGENFKYKVMVDYTNEINESIQLIPEDIQNMVENAIKEIINKKNNWGDITSDMILSDKSPLEI